MSDEQAKAKKQDEEALEQQRQEQAKRIWALTIVFDPETGQVELLGNENVKKPWQIDLCLDRALKTQKMGIVASAVRGVLVMMQGNKKPGKIVPPR